MHRSNEKTIGLCVIVCEEELSWREVELRKPSAKKKREIQSKLWRNARCKTKTTALIMEIWVLTLKTAASYTPHLKKVHYSTSETNGFVLQT